MTEYGTNNDGGGAASAGEANSLLNIEGLNVSFTTPRGTVDVVKDVSLALAPGKALALADTCFPEVVLGPVPVIYPFIVNNPGEAVQAAAREHDLTLREAATVLAVKRVAEAHRTRGLYP